MYGCMEKKPWIPYIENLIPLNIYHVIIDNFLFKHESVNFDSLKSRMLKLRFPSVQTEDPFSIQPSDNVHSTAHHNQIKIRLS